MVNYKSKYLKYKLKYKKLKGGALGLNKDYTGYNEEGKPFKFNIVNIFGNSYTLKDATGHQTVKTYNEVMDLIKQVVKRVNQAEYSSMAMEGKKYTSSSTWQINQQMPKLIRSNSTDGISTGSIEPVVPQSQFTKNKSIVPTALYPKVVYSDESARRPNKIYSPEFHPDNLNLNNTCICFILAHGVDIGQTNFQSTPNLYIQHFTQPEELCLTIEYKNFFDHIAQTLINYQTSEQAANSLQHTLNEIDHGLQFHPQPIKKYKGEYVFEDNNLTFLESYNDIYFFNPYEQNFIRKGIPVNEKFIINLSRLIDNYILPECNKENLYIGLLTCRGGKLFDEIKDNNCTACRNGERPCCNKSRDGDDCSFTNFSNKNERQQELENYENFEFNNNLSERIPESLSEQQAKDLAHSIKLRQEWMSKHLKPECDTCDADCKNHLGRIKASKRALNKHYIPGM